jgi:crossover junction endodeoxyribonuclease RuvC
LRRRILGVDPGTRCAGWAVIAGSVYKPELVACGEIRLPARLAFARRLADLHEGIAAVVAQHEPSDAAVEAPFHGISARSALQLAHARGVVLAALGAAQVPVYEYAPATIKQSVTGNGRAEKAQVAAMVGKLVTGGEACARPDVADAIATALCHLFAAGAADAIGRKDLARARR